MSTAKKARKIDNTTTKKTLIMITAENNRRITNTGKKTMVMKMVRKRGATKREKKKCSARNMFLKRISAKSQKRSAMLVVVMTAIAEAIDAKPLDNTQVDGQLKMLMSQALQISAVRKKKKRKLI